MHSNVFPKAGCALSVLVLLAGCARESSSRTPARYGSGAYAPSQAPPNGYRGGPNGYAPPGQTTPARPAGQANMLIGPAVTPFGLVFQQLPQLPMQFPPLPSISDWSNLPWVFPWPAPTPPSPSPAPNPGPAPGADNWRSDWAAFEDDVLRRTNEQRALGAVCGGRPMGPAAPLSAQGQLRNAARGHSQDMGTRHYFDHSSPEGRGPSDRAVAAGYQSSFVGENIAAGQADPAAVVRAWVESPGHCLNMMDPRYRFLGVGYYFQPGDRFGHYWTQDFGG
jgi:uncharacterized protein YkwD